MAIESENCFVTEGQPSEPRMLMSAKEGMVIKVKLDVDGNLWGYYDNPPFPQDVTRVLRATGLQDREGRIVTALHYHHLEGLFAQFDHDDAEWYLVESWELKTTNQ